MAGLRRVQLSGFGELCLRFREFAQLGKRQPIIVVKRRLVGLEIDRFLVRNESRVESGVPICVGLSAGPADVGFRKVRPDVPLRRVQTRGFFQVLNSPREVLGGRGRQPGIECIAKRFVLGECSSPLVSDLFAPRRVTGLPGRPNLLEIHLHLPLEAVPVWSVILKAAPRPERSLLGRSRTRHTGHLKPQRRPFIGTSSGDDSH